VGDRREQRRRHRQVERPDVARLLVELLGEGRPAGVAGGVDRHVVDAVQELLDQLRLQELRIHELVQRVARRLAELRLAHLGARRPDHPRARGHLVHRQPAEQARQDLAVREISGGSEDHQVEGRHGNDG
jgi:hypothetical protein